VIASCFLALSASTVACRSPESPSRVLNRANNAYEDTIIYKLPKIIYS